MLISKSPRLEDIMGSSMAPRALPSFFAISKGTNDSVKKALMGDAWRTSTNPSNGINVTTASFVFQSTHEALAYITF